MDSIKKLEMWRDAVSVWPSDKFSIHYWAAPFNFNREDAFNVNANDFDFTCLCAGSIACRVPEFIAAGLHLAPKFHRVNCWYFCPEFENIMGNDALARFFQVASEDMKRVTSHTAYGSGSPNLTDALQHINILIDKYKLVETPKLITKIIPARELEPA